MRRAVALSEFERGKGDERRVCEFDVRCEDDLVTRHRLMLEDVLDHPGRADARQLDVDLLAELATQCLGPTLGKIRAPAKEADADRGAVVAGDLRREKRVPVPVQAQGLDSDVRGWSLGRVCGHGRFLCVVLGQRLQGLVAQLAFRLVHLHRFRSVLVGGCTNDPHGLEGLVQAA